MFTTTGSSPFRVTPKASELQKIEQVRESKNNKNIIAEIWMNKKKIWRHP